MGENGLPSKHDSNDVQAAMDEETRRGIAVKGRKIAEGGYFFTHELRQIGLHVETDDHFVFTLSGKLPDFKKFEELLRDELTPMGNLRAELVKIIKRYPNLEATVILVGQRLIAEQWNLPGKYRLTPKPVRREPANEKECLEAIANSYIDGLPPEELERLVRLAKEQFGCKDAEIGSALKVGRSIAS